MLRHVHHTPCILLHLLLRTLRQLRIRARQRPGLHQRPPSDVDHLRSERHATFLESHQSTGEDTEPGDGGHHVVWEELEELYFQDAVGSVGGEERFGANAILDCVLAGQQSVGCVRVEGAQGWSSGDTKGYKPLEDFLRIDE